jgi:lipoprotein-anchoring transpeptidase ErfK/SrfK
MLPVGEVEAHSWSPGPVRVVLLLAALSLTSCPSGATDGGPAWFEQCASRFGSDVLKTAARRIIEPENILPLGRPLTKSQTDPIATALSAKVSAAAVATPTIPEEDPMPGDAERVLVSIGRETWIYTEPRLTSRKAGYLRFGAVVGRAMLPAGREDCSQGWYRISPDGYACNNGRTATLDLDNRLVSMGRQRPDRLSGLPYVYGVPRGAAPPLYARLPTREEQQSIESAVQSGKLARDWQQFSLSPLPSWLRQTANIFGYPRDKGSLLMGTTVPRSAFSLLGLFEDEGRAFGLTADLALVPLGRLRPVEASHFHGLNLSEQQGLPVVFAMRGNAGIYAGDPEHGKLSLLRQAEYRQAFSLTGRRVAALGTHWVELQSGEWMRDERLLHVEAPANWPSWAVAGRTWVDVSISAQTLVAYEGTKPIYVTLVSTGAAGLEDPHKTTATKRGTFQIHAKHVTSTMDGNEPGHEFDLRDVPWVQYFTEGYALHAAYWHDDFGHPRSHGCVNLAPLDARWLFHFTTPAVPQAWHGMLAHGESTIVNVHP